MNTRELATRVYEALNENGAELGSMSIFIIKAEIEKADNAEVTRLRTALEAAPNIFFQEESEIGADYRRWFDDQRTPALEATK